MQAGYYKGTVSKKVITRGKNGAIQLDALCHLDGMTMRAFINLSRNDGTHNEVQINNLKEAFGWTDGSLKTLANMDTSKKEVSFKVQKTDNEKYPFEIAFINPVLGAKPPEQKEDIDALDKLFQSAPKAAVPAGDVPSF